MTHSDWKLNKPRNGDTSDAEEINDTSALTIGVPMLNRIRMLTNYTPENSTFTGDHMFVEAYTDSNGKLNTVDTSSTETTAFFDTGDVEYQSGYNYSNSSIQYQDSDNMKNGSTSSSYSHTLIGIPFTTTSSTFNNNVGTIVTYARIFWQTGNTGSTAGRNLYCKIQKRSGSSGSWTTIATRSQYYPSAAAMPGSIGHYQAFAFGLGDYSSYCNPGYQLRILWELYNSSGSNSRILGQPSVTSSQWTHSQNIGGTPIATHNPGSSTPDNIYPAKYWSTSGTQLAFRIGSVRVTSGTQLPTTVQVAHDIPSGTFPSNASTLVGKAMVSKHEGDATIYHKITNSLGEDSGWFGDTEIGQFQPFTAEPDKYYLRLVPTTTGTPTIGFPAVKGGAIQVW